MPDDKLMFVLFLSYLVGFQYHPANRENWPDIDFEEMARVADELVRLVERRFN